MTVQERSLSNTVLVDGQEHVNETNTTIKQSNSISVPSSAVDNSDNNKPKDDAPPQQQSSPQVEKGIVAVEAPTAVNITTTTEEEYESEHKQADNQSRHHPSDKPSSPTSPVWEEEATPTQTAFAKSVIFRHRPYLKDQDSSDKPKDTDEEEVLSTASEMGTVVGEARLQDLDRELANQNHVESIIPDGQLFTTSVWPDTTVDTQSPSNHTIQKDKYDFEDIRRTDSGLSAEASERLTQAIRRIGSGLSTNKNYHGTSRSTPSTPRPRSMSTGDDHWTPTGSPRTPTSRHHHQQQQHPLPQQQQQSASFAPSSFLLRSPGSAAFCEAKISHSGRKTTPSGTGNSTNRHNHALLSPRFWRVPPAINEQEESTDTGPALPELHSHTGNTTSAAVPHSPIHPLQMAARACFSFDAYYNDTADDREDPYYDYYTQQSLSSPQQSSSRSSNYRSSRRKRRTGATQVLQSSQSWDGRWGMTNVGSASNSTRSPKSETNNQSDVERQDALDLLSCIVERGITLPKDDQDSRLDEPTVARLQEAAKQDPALEQILRSYEYAMEMSRASHSEAARLKSIGRSSDNKNSTAFKRLNINDSLITHAGSESPGEMDDTDKDTMDVATIRSLWAETQNELTMKTSQLEDLNQELAKCRAEIGRLKTQQQQQHHQLTPFQSPNRSIFDIPNEDDEEDDDEDEDGTEESPVERDDSYLDRSFPSHQHSHHPNIFVDGTGELEKYKQALQEANQRIKELYERNVKTENGEVGKPAPTVVVDSVAAPPSPGNTADTFESMDADNFETQWSELVPSLPPPPDHGLKSPIVETVMEAWTLDTGLHKSLYEWIELVLSGTSPDDIPPLAISNLESQVRDGLVMHVLPLLHRRADVRVEVQTRTLRRTTYDLAVSIESTSTPLMDIPVRRRNWENLALQSDAGASVTHSSVTALMDNQSRRAARVASAFRARGDPISEVDNYYGPESPDQRQSTPGLVQRDDKLTAPANSGFSYDEMTEDLSANGSSHTPGLMSALGDAIGGLMLRRPTPREAASPAMATVVGSHLSEAERFRAALQSEEKKSKQHKGGNDASSLASLTVTTATETDVDGMNSITPKASNHHNPDGSLSSTKPSAMMTPFRSPPLITRTPSNDTYDDEEGYTDHAQQQQQDVADQSYHRVVSAPPGRIGVTFVEFRGHAMVSDVATDSPLSGWMFPSDILIAIDELPVSGMRVRDIIQILRERVDNQRALRVISCHAMDDYGFGLNTSHVSTGEVVTG
jgi:hypothetical protein